MTAKKILQKLVRGGALISDASLNGMRTLPIYADLVTPAPGQIEPDLMWFYWVQANAEDQHHTHFRPYAYAEIVHDRNLKFSDAYGRPVAYIAPFEEWPEHDVESLQRELASARRAVNSTPERAKAWARFVRNCSPE